MRRSVLCCAAGAALALLAAPRPAAAQLAPRGINPFSFGVSGGVTVPTGEFSDAFSTGLNVDAFVALRAPALPVSLRIEGGYQRFGLKGSVRDLLEEFGGSGDVTASIVSGTANLVYTAAIPASPVRPYLIAGAGVYNLRARVTGALVEELGGTFDQSTTRLGLNGGFGVGVPLGRATLFGEVRVHTIFTPSERDPDTGERIGGRTTLVPLKVGLRF
jgi:hypothetical protein